jgi:hypothetical protein
MFAKLAKIRTSRHGRIGHGPIVLGHVMTPTHANDNRAGKVDGTVAERTARPVLACRWIEVAGGRLECRWAAERSGATSPEEPQSRRMASRGRPVVGVVDRSRTLAVGMNGAAVS